MISVNGLTKGEAAESIRSIAVIGGGAVGWMAAAALARVLPPGICAVQLLDAAAPGSPFGDATLPSFHRLNRVLGIDEYDLLARTRGTFRLGTEFCGWGGGTQIYFHGFGPLGVKIDAVPFHHYWLRLRRAARVDPVDRYSIAAIAARRGRFARPLSDRRSALSLYSYGYHVHTDSFADHMRRYALAHGVTRIAAPLEGVLLDAADGSIESLKLGDGSRLRADLYLDCTGAPGLVAGQVPGAGFEDWSHWLPCDRMLSVAADREDLSVPYSRSSAEREGWRRRIPLQHAWDESLVYSRRHLDDDAAAVTLGSRLGARVLAGPKLLERPGRPAQFWNKNCISIASGVTEPLEGTGLHLSQTGITRLLAWFPACARQGGEAEEYNRLTIMEHERIRDYLILHYKLSRYDSPFWEECRRMPIPDSLAAKLELFERAGRIAMCDDEHFNEDSWISLLLGQGVIPDGHDPLADVLGEAEAREALHTLRAALEEGAEQLPEHGRFVREHCAAAREWQW